MSQVEGKPFSANSTEGFTKSAQGLDPSFPCAIHKPATVPGTPTERGPS